MAPNILELLLNEDTQKYLIDMGYDKELLEDMIEEVKKLKQTKKKNNEKSRYWAFIYYEESPIKDYRKYLSEYGARAIISPWHDKDINELTGELKKKHKHIILCYEGPTTRNQVNELIEPFNAPIPIPQVNIKGAIRYLTHANNPEKHQYDKNDIELVGYETLEEVIDLTNEDIKEIWLKLKELVNIEKIKEYSDIVDWFLENGYILEFDYVINHTISVKSYIDSARNKELRKK